MLVPLLAALIGVAENLDGGAGWTQSVADFGDAWVLYVAPAPTDPRIAYVELDDGGFRKSTDGGTSWFNPSATEAPGFGVGPDTALAVSPESADVVLMGGVGNGLAGSTVKSTDGGATWAVVAANLPTAVAFDPRNPRHVVGGFERDVDTGFTGESWDGGSTWEMYAAPANAAFLDFDPVAPGVVRGVFLEASLDLYRSEDSGHTWRRVGPLPDNSGDPPAVAFDRVDPSTIYASTRSDGWRPGLSRSTDGGRTWVGVDGGLDALPAGQEWFPQVLLDPNDHRHVIVLGKSVPFPELLLPVGSIYESFDSGASWSDASLNLPESVIGPLAFGSDGRLFAPVFPNRLLFLRPPGEAPIVRPPAKPTPVPISGRP
jgi:hypothetical protein